MKRVEVENIRQVYYEKVLVENLQNVMDPSDFEMVENFDQKINEYTRALIKSQRKASSLADLFDRNMAKRKTKSLKKEIHKLFADSFNNKVHVDSYIGAMFNYFLTASKHYDAILHDEQPSQPSYLTKHIEALQDTKKMFINSLTHAIVYENLHRSNTFFYTTHMITQIAEVVKDDEISRRNSLKRYHPDEINDKSLSREELFDTTIKKLRPSVRKLYSFFKHQVETSKNPLIAGQLLYYVDVISKMYQGGHNSNSTMIQADTRAKVVACKIATGIMERHFKYFDNHLVFPVNADLAIEDFKNCRPYSPAGHIKPIGCISGDKTGIYAKPRVKITLAEKEENLDGKDK